MLLALALSGCGSKSSPDAVPPVVSLNGAALIVLSLHEDFSDPGATATDDRDGAVAVRVSGSVDSDRAGEYTLTYSAADAAGNSASTARTVRVVDDIPPVVTLNGEPEMSISYRDAFADPGATATDDPDGALPVTVTGTVESGRIGEYALTYSATDAAGNAAEATRAVRVVDDVPPAITLDGSAVVELERDEPYWDPGATAEDEIDGAVETTVRGEVGEAAGEYALVYRAVDAAGNAAEATRAVTRAPGDYMLDVNVFGAGEVRLAAGEATTPFRCEDDTCFGRFREGERVELEATAGPGRRFDGWGEGMCDEIADGRCALAMDRNRIALPAFVSEEPLTMHDDVVVLTPEQIEGLLFWAPDSGVAAFDEWTDLRELAPGSVMVSYGVPDEDGFPTEPVFLARVLSVLETPDGSQLVATAPAGLDDLYASGTLVASGALTRSAMERAKLAPGVKLAPAPHGSRAIECSLKERNCIFTIADRGPLTDIRVAVWGTPTVRYDAEEEEDRLTRVELNVTAEAGFTVVAPGELRLPIKLGSAPVWFGPFLFKVEIYLVPQVALEGDFSDAVKGRATLVVVGSRYGRSLSATFDPGFALVDRFDFLNAAVEGRPNLRLGLQLIGDVSLLRSAGLKMAIEPYYGARLFPSTSRCELKIYPYWGVGATVDAYLGLWGFFEGRTRLLTYNDTDSLSTITRTFPCDREDPTPPRDFAASTRTDGGVALGWSASTDNRGVTAYRVYRGSRRIATTGATNYVDSSPGTGRHCYYAKAVDAAGNRSRKSGTACATVQPDPPQSRPAKPAVEIREETSGSIRSYWLSWSPEQADVEYWILARFGGNWRRTVQATGNPRRVVPYGTGPQSCYRIRATNGAGSTDSDSRCFTPRGNTPPTAYAGDDFTVVARELGTLRGRGTDADGRVDGYEWTQTGRPTVTLSDASSATATFTAPDTDVETTLTFQLTVTDNDGATHTNDVRATVLPAETPANGPPTADAGDRQNVTAGERVTLSGSRSSDDRGIVSWRWEQYLGRPIVSLSGASSQDATFDAPSVTEVTDLRFRLTVTDGDGATGRDTVRVRVSPPATNRPPRADAGSDQSVASGAAVTLSGSGSDPDGDALSYAWRQTDDGPTVTLSGASSATATFTAPTVGTRRTLTFHLTVTDDDGATGSDTVDVTVSPLPTNRSPVASAGTNQSVASGAAVTLNGSGTDPDGSVTDYAWTQTGGPTVALSGASSATATFTAPAVTARTALTFRLTVTDDDGATGADETTVTISPPATNLPPAANAGLDQSVAAGAAVTLSGSGSDPDGSVAGYAWTQTSGTTVTLSGAATATATFTAPAVTTRTTLTFQLTVTDDDGATGSDEATVTVSPPATNRPPVANAGLDQSVAAGAAVTLSGSGSDPDGSVAGYAWTQTEGTTVSLSGASTAMATFTAPAVTTRTTLTFRLTVTDNVGATGADDATVTVSPAVDNTPVNIPDAALRTALLAALGKSAGDTITRSDMAGITSFRAVGSGIADLTGLEFATSLTGLDLTNNQISDISALSGLTSLISLTLDQNSISNVSALSRLTSLITLTLEYNSISDISALSRLTSLERLFLSYNQISNISALSGLTSLERVDLNRNSISNIPALSGLTSIEAMHLAGNSISDISGLSGRTSLILLNLRRNQVSNISALSRLTSLERLYLPDNSISNISALSELTSLIDLELDGNSISDISALSRLTSITDLGLEENLISDISALSGLTSINDLYLEENLISNVKPLVDNTGLGSGDDIHLRKNPLSAQSVNTHIPALRARGVDVSCSLVDGTRC